MPGGQVGLLPPSADTTESAVDLVDALIPTQNQPAMSTADASIHQELLPHQVGGGINCGHS